MSRAIHLCVVAESFRHQKALRYASPSHIVDLCRISLSRARISHIHPALLSDQIGIPSLLTLGWEKSDTWSVEDTILLKSSSEPAERGLADESLCKDREALEVRDWYTFGLGR